jgi:hypothetical protein
MIDPDFWLAVGIMGRVHYGSTDKQRVVDHIATLSLCNDINLTLVPVRRADEHQQEDEPAIFKRKSCHVCGCRFEGNVCPGPLCS